MLCVFTLLLTACGKDDNDNSMDARLCRTWIEEYTEDNITYTHQLIFTQAGYSGQELKRNMTIPQVRPIQKHAISPGSGKTARWSALY